MAVAGSAIYDAAGSYTWTRPAGTELVEVVVLGGGGAGGSGGRYPSGNFAEGGSGGGGGGLTRVFLSPTDTGASLALVVAAATATTAGNNTDTSAGATGANGNHSRFGSSDAAALARGSGGVGGVGGANVGNPAGGVGGGGTWKGGQGIGAFGVAGILGDFIPGGVPGGYMDNTNAAFVAAPGQWPSAVRNGLTHPPAPQPGAINSGGGATGNNGFHVNSLARAFITSTGAGGATSTANHASWGQVGNRGAGGSGGGGCRNGWVGGNGGYGAGGMAVIISHGADVDARTGTGAGTLALGGAAPGRRQFLAGSAKGTMSLTARAPGGKRTIATGLGIVPIGAGAPQGVKFGLAKASFAIIARAPGVRRSSGTGHGIVAVVGQARWEGIFVSLNPPTKAHYLDRPTKAHYHSTPTIADYLVRPIRALYDGAMGERVPWMAGQRRGSIRAALTDANGPIEGLAAAEGVWFCARRLADGLGEVFGPAVIENATEAVVRYDPADGDFAEPGQYAVQWLIVHSGSLPMYVPDDGYDELDALTPIHAAP